MVNSVKYSHFLFDYDGLLVDTEKLYFETWCRVLTPEGQEICHHFHEGKHESEVYEKVRPYLIQPMTLEEVSAYRRIIFNKLISGGRLELMDGIKDLLVKLKNTASMSIVSNSRIDVVEAGIRNLGIKDYFSHLFCFSDEVDRKPSPDLYNLAISTLKLNKGSTLALEDAVSGIIAAQRAGVPVICINPSTLMKEYCRKHFVRYFKSAVDMIIKL